MRRSDEAARLVRIAAELWDQPDEDRAVQAIVHSAAELLPDAQHVSVTVRQRREFVTLAATSRTAQAADDVQYEKAEGPCLEAATEVDLVHSADISQDSRWPLWGPEAARLGLRSLLSVGLTAGGTRLGALNMYTPVAGRFHDAEVRDLALLYASHAGRALASARLVSGLQTAMGSRHVIGAAQGILMERYGLDIEGSFALLQRLSSTHNRKLRDLAEELVDTGVLEELRRENPQP